MFAQTALVSIGSRPVLIFYFPFPDNENYDIFSILEVKVIYEDMRPSFSQKAKMSGKSNVCLNMSQFRHPRMSTISIIFKNFDVGT